MDVSREDLCLFLNACAVATGQREFYSSDSEQQVSLRFLHEYICVNYRLAYARTLAAGLNHFNQCEIIFHLLRTGKNTHPEHRTEESSLITAALQELPPQRAWKLFARIQNERVNNRRTRKLIHNFIASRRDLVFDAVKYRSKLRAAVRHSHLKMSGEVPVFLFEGIKRNFKTPLLEQFRAAHFSKRAVYDLPYSIAEGFAAQHGIPRQEFLEQIQGKLTERERLRLQSAAEGKVELNAERLSLTELCVYILSLSIEERCERRVQLEQWLNASVESTRRNIGALPTQGKIAAVLDNSYSASGSRQKQNRPLAIAWAAHLVLKEASSTYRPFWTSPVRDELLLFAIAQTHLTERILDALEWGAETVVVISDGCENDVPGAAEAVYKAYRKMGGKASVIHLNPVFNPDSYQVHALIPELPALGIRAGEDIATALTFGKFTAGDISYLEVENYLKGRADELIKPRN